MLEHEKAAAHGNGTAPPGDTLAERAGVDRPAQVDLCRPRQLLELVCKAVGAPMGGIGVLTADGKLREHWMIGFADDTQIKLKQTPSGAALVHYILQRTSPLHIHDFEPVRQELELPAELGSIGSLLGASLVYHGRPLGAFYLARPRGEPAFGAEDVQVVLPIRQWLAQGDLFEEARLLAQLRLLTRIAQAAADSRDLTALLRVALHELERHLPLYVGAIWILQEKPSNETAGAHGMLGDLSPAPQTPETTGGSAPAGFASPAVLKLAELSSVPRHRAEALGLTSGMQVELEQTPFAACLRDGQALYVDLARSDERRSPFIDNLAARGANSIFAVPLRAGQQPVGILLSVCTRSSGFTNEQIQILYQVADMLGPAICNCKLFGRLRGAYEELRHAQSQLIKAEKMRALGELAGGMAHDFNNALCGALGFLELVLADKRLDGVNRGHLESARTCTLDAAETVRRVQDFARWQRKEFSTEVIDLNEVVRQTMELARHKWESLNHARGTPVAVELVTEATEKLCASAAELREVLTNLVFNGVDAMPQGGKLTVRTWSDEQHVYLSVSDTGIGISESVRHRLFEPFFTTKGERGNGLGLSVTFGIIQRYNGDISVESTVGQGATFVVKIPYAPLPPGAANGQHAERGRPGGKDTSTPADPKLANGPEAQGVRGYAVVHDSPGVGAERAFPETPLAVHTTPASQPDSKPSAGAGRGPSEPGAERGSPDPAPPARSTHRGLRVLVIEDEESIRRFLSTGLKHLGHRARLASNGDEGLALFAAESFDVVLTDLGLPGISGEEVARTISRRSPTTPVILLTGWSHQLRDAGQPLEGVQRVLGKPVTLAALNGALAGVCQG